MQFRRTFHAGVLTLGTLHIINELFLSFAGPLTGDSQSTQSDRLKDFFGVSWWTLLSHNFGLSKWYYGGLVVFNYGVIAAVLLAIVSLASKPADGVRSAFPPRSPVPQGPTSAFAPSAPQASAAPAPVPPGIEQP